MAGTGSLSSSPTASQTPTDPPRRIDAALDAARRWGVDRLDAQLLLCALVQQSRAWLAAHGDAELDATQSGTFLLMLSRRAGGEPLAYVLGQAEFCGIRIAVTPAVLIPRPETELLVRWALDIAQRAAPTAIVDLGTGSGAIALSLAKGWPPDRPRPLVCASDASASALAVARFNAATHAVEIDWGEGDWWAPWAGQLFELAVSNPPYIDGDDPHLQALTHEPRAALSPAADGLAALRAIVHGAPPCLRSGAWLLLEHGHDQAEAVRRLLSERGFEHPETRFDLAGLPRCSGARWPGREIVPALRQ